MPRKKPTPRDPTRRRRILDAAKAHFTRGGFKGANLDAIADDAGVSKGALYLEFDDKQALLAEVVRELYAGIGARYAAEVLPLESPLARLRETLRFAYREMGREPLFGRLIREDPEMRALRAGQHADEARAAAAQLDMLVGWVDEGIARGEIREDVDRRAVPLVLGVLRFAPQHLELVRSLGLMSPERVLDAIVDVFEAGLAARPPRARSGSKSERAPRARNKRAKR